MYRKGNKELPVLGLYLGDYSGRFYLREISRLCRMPLKTAQRVLESLEKARILRSEVHGKNKYFSLNLGNIETKNMLLQAEIWKTSELLRKYPFFGAFLKEMKAGQAPVIVFGSFAKFTAGKISDVDILVLSGRKLDMPSHLLPNEIHQINVAADAFGEALKKGEAFAKEVAESHVVLNSHSFFVNLMWEKHAK